MNHTTRLIFASLAALSASVSVLSLSSTPSISVTLESTSPSAVSERRSPLPVTIVDPPRSASVGQPLTFTAATASAGPGVTISYVWSFGDQINATGQTVTHTYTRGRNYVVTLTVKASNGIAVSTDALVDISPPYEMGAVVSVRGGWNLVAGPSGTILRNYSACLPTQQRAGKLSNYGPALSHPS